MASHRDVPLSDGRVARVGLLTLRQIAPVMAMEQDDAVSIMSALAATATIDGKPVGDEDAVQDMPFVDVQAIAQASMSINAIGEAAGDTLGEG